MRWCDRGPAPSARGMTVATWSGVLPEANACHILAPTLFRAKYSPRARSMMTSFGYVAHGGTYVLVSIVRDTISFDDAEFHKRETTLLGSRNATPEDFHTVGRDQANSNAPGYQTSNHALSHHTKSERLSSTVLLT